MNNTLKRMLSLIATLLIFYATASVVATITQLAAGADRVYQGAGQPVFWLLLVSMSVLVGAPLVLFFRLPKALIAPASTENPLYPAYLSALEQHLRSHPKLAKEVWPNEDPIDWALARLEVDANKCIRDTASGVFITTALMQNGRLEGILMLAAQLRLVWKVASIYHLRPSLRQILYLYSNVGTAMLISTEIDDVDFAELASPLVTAVVPSISGAVPGLQAVAGLLVNSLASGAANAFLTLRVGYIAKEYCAPIVGLTADSARRSATKVALRELGSITMESGTKVAKGVWTGSTRAVKAAAVASFQSIKTTSGAAMKSSWEASANTGYKVKSVTVNMSKVVAETSVNVKDKLTSAVDVVWDTASKLIKAPGKLMKGQAKP